jgi:hypothetical protein
LASLTQFVKYRGAIVVGTTSSKKMAYPEDTVKRTLYIMNQEGFHCVFDGLVKDAFVVFIVEPF